MNKPYGEVTELMKIMGICPKCKREDVMKYPALSRRDNEYVAIVVQPKHYQTIF